MSHQPHPGVPSRQRPAGGGGGQWEAEPHAPGRLCLRPGGLPDPAAQGLRSGRSQGVCVYGCSDRVRLTLDSHLG